MVMDLLTTEKPIFKTKTRPALYHLLNRELMIEKFRYGMDLPAILALVSAISLRRQKCKASWF